MWLANFWQQPTEFEYHLHPELIDLKLDETYHVKRNTHGWVDVIDTDTNEILTCLPPELMRVFFTSPIWSK